MGASWQAALLATTGGKEDGEEGRGKRRSGDFDLLMEKEGPRVVWDKVVGRTGKVLAVGEDEEVEEKTMLQK